MTKEAELDKTPAANVKPADTKNSPEEFRQKLEESNKLAELEIEKTKLNKNEDNQKKLNDVKKRMEELKSQQSKMNDEAKKIEDLKKEVELQSDKLKAMEGENTIGDSKIITEAKITVLHLEKERLIEKYKKDSEELKVKMNDLKRRINENQLEESKLIDESVKLKEELRKMDDTKKPVAGNLGTRPKADSNSSDYERLERLLSNKYRILKQIFKTNRSTLYQVRDNRSEDFKCLKVSNVDAFESNEIESEAKILLKLEHPYVLKYYINFIRENYVFTVTELCEESLRDKLDRWIRENRRPAEYRLKSFIAQLLCACYYIHSRGIIHRNIKPENILIKNETIKLCDFGTSKKLLHRKDVANTLVGTPIYMAPEMIEGKEYNYKTDIWALGVCFFQMTTLATPFGEMKNGIHYIMTNAVRNDVPTIGNGFSLDISSLIYKCLEKSPEKRPTAGELLCEDVIFKSVKGSIERSLKCERTESNMSQLVASLDHLNKVRMPEVVAKQPAENKILKTPL